MWRQSKKINDDLDAILMRIGHMERSIESMKDHTRQMHNDVSDKQKLAYEKLCEIKDAIPTIVPAKKPGRKPKNVPAPL